MHHPKLSTVTEKLQSHVDTFQSKALKSFSHFADRVFTWWHRLSCWSPPGGWPASPPGSCPRCCCWGSPPCWCSGNCCTESRKRPANKLLFPAELLVYCYCMCRVHKTQVIFPASINHGQYILSSQDIQICIIMYQRRSRYHRHKTNISL